MLADVTFSTEAITTISVLVGSLIAAIGFLFKSYMKEKDDRLEDMKSQRDDYKKVAVSTVEVAEHVVHRQLQKKGLVPVTPLAAVEAEHNSPVTQDQTDRAEFATIQARRRAIIVEVDRLEEVGTDTALPVAPPVVKVEIVAAAIPIAVVATEPVPVKVVEDKKP